MHGSLHLKRLVIPSRILFILPWICLIAACAVNTPFPVTPTYTLVGPTSTSIPPTQLPSPTPVPLLLLISDAPDGGVEQEVRDWATDHAWQVLVVSPDLTLEDALADGHLQIVVSVRSGLGEELATHATGWRLLAVDEEGVRANEEVSVVGGEGSQSAQVGFLAGLIGGFGNQTGWVGILQDPAYPDVDLLNKGFNQGVKYSCPRCKIVSQSLDTWDPGTYAARDVRVIYTPINPTAQTTIEALQELGYWIILSDEGFEGSNLDRVAGRVRMRASHLAREALDEILAGKSGKAWPYSVENGGIALDGLNPSVISPGREQRLMEIQEEIARGLLDIGVNGE